jgi:hypothetical protein
VYPQPLPSFQSVSVLVISELSRLGFVRGVIRGVVADYGVDHYCSNAPEYFFLIYIL